MEEPPSTNNLAPAEVNPGNLLAKGGSPMMLLERSVQVMLTGSNTCMSLRGPGIRLQAFTGLQRSCSISKFSKNQKKPLKKRRREIKRCDENEGGQKVEHE
jgi:hypothetical protein